MKRINVYQKYLVILSFLGVFNVFSQNSGDNKLTSKQWQEDVAFLLNEMPNVHIDPYHTTSKENFELFSDALLGKIPNMTDNEIITEIARLTAMVGDGHTAMNIFGYHGSNTQSLFNLHVLPLRLYLFTDGLYVIGAAPQYQSLKGSRITKISGKDIEEVLNKLKPIIPRDNEYSLKNNIPYYLVIPEFLNGLGIIDNVNEVEFTTITPEGIEKTVSVGSTELKNLQHNSGASDDKGLP